ncbi:hypothetical protein TWF718_011249 [Orbilia javanica]|uniref:Uncharacterized protein n=1 Tax=Orbilia javanica TaxID=47235 RepID=A0AAN8MTG2_9PEZI
MTSYPTYNNTLGPRLNNTHLMLSPASISNPKIPVPDNIVLPSTAHNDAPPSSAAGGEVEDPQPEQTGSSSHVNPSKRTDPPMPVNPNIFYRIRGTVQCPTRRQLGKMDDDPSHYPTFPPAGRSSTQKALRIPLERPRFNDGSIKPITKFRRRDDWLLRCSDCECDTETSRIVTNSNAASRAAARSTAILKCHHVGIPPRCEAWINCHCVFEMHQPPRFRDVPVEDYQDALNRIPKHIKEQFPDYTWSPHPGWEMKWSGNEGESSGQSTHKQLAPGTKEPYYLEGPGPDYKDPKMRDWPGMLTTAADLVSPFGGSGYMKRDLEKRNQEKGGEENGDEENEDGEEGDEEEES